MKHYTREDIAALERQARANLINSATGYKPANLIGTISADGATNLAIFSSVVHLGANPPLVGFVLRPVAEVPRHTYENIRATGVYTINHVHEPFAERAHFTSAKFARGESEFDKCGLGAEFLDGFAAPFVRESAVRMGLRYVDELPVRQNDTIFVIGEIVHLFAPESAVGGDGALDLGAVADVCVSGLDTYHRVEKLATYPYARPSNVPDFER